MHLRSSRSADRYLGGLPTSYCSQNTGLAPVFCVIPTLQDILQGVYWHHTNNNNWYMKDIYYIHDAVSGKLVIREFHEAANGDIEERIEAEADREDMHWSDCSWGGVSSISINI